MPLWPPTTEDTTRGNHVIWLTCLAARTARRDLTPQTHHLYATCNYAVTKRTHFPFSLWTGVHIPERACIHLLYILAFWYPLTYARRVSHVGILTRGKVCSLDVGLIRYLFPICMYIPDYVFFGVYLMMTRDGLLLYPFGLWLDAPDWMMWAGGMWLGRGRRSRPLVYAHGMTSEVRKLPFRVKISGWGKFSNTFCALECINML